MQTELKWSFLRSLLQLRIDFSFVHSGSLAGGVFVVGLVPLGVALDGAQSTRGSVTAEVLTRWSSLGTSAGATRALVSI